MAKRAVKSDSGISKLAPIVPGREFRKQREAIASDLLREVILAAATHRNPADMLLEIYLAGLYHGAEIGRRNGAIYAGTPEPERARDYITI